MSGKYWSKNESEPMPVRSWNRGWSDQGNNTSAVRRRAFPYIPMYDKRGWPHRTNPCRTYRSGQPLFRSFSVRHRASALKSYCPDLQLWKAVWSQALYFVPLLRSPHYWPAHRGHTSSSIRPSVHSVWWSPMRLSDLPNRAAKRPVPYRNVPFPEPEYPVKE